MLASQPRTQVHLIDRHGGLEQFRIPTLIHPLLVFPLVAIDIGDDRSRFRRRFHAKTIRIGLHLAIPTEARFDRVLVGRADLHARNEDFPNTACSQAHGIASGIPIVEIADDTHHDGVWRPHRKPRALQPIKRHDVCAERLVAFVICPFRVKVQVKITE